MFCYSRSSLQQTSVITSNVAFYECESLRSSSMSALIVQYFAPSLRQKKKFQLEYLSLWTKKKVNLPFSFPLTLFAVRLISAMRSSSCCFTSVKQNQKSETQIHLACERFKKIKWRKSSLTIVSLWCAENCGMYLFHFFDICLHLFDVFSNLFDLKKPKN